MSYRFYDPILQIVQDQIEDDRKEHFFNTNLMNYNFFKKTNISYKINNQLLSAGDKLSQKYTILNKKEDHMDHNKCANTMTLQ